MNEFGLLCWCMKVIWCIWSVILVIYLVIVKIFGDLFAVCKDIWRLKRHLEIKILVPELGVII